MPITVLIADDHSVLRDGLSALLALNNDISVVGTAMDGRQAVALAQQLHPDVVIMDIAMPELNGIEAARAISARTPDISIIMLSMHAGAEYIYQSLGAGAQGYLLKQSASSEIVEAVRAVASGRRYLGESVARTMAERKGAAAGSSALDGLSSRERQVLQLVAEGRTSAYIAAQLHLSPKTVDTYRSRLMQKLDIADMAGLVKFSILHGLTSLE